MMETTPQIGEAPEEVCANAIFNHKHNYKKRLHDQNYAHSGRSTQLKGKLFLEVTQGVC